MGVLVDGWEKAFDNYDLTVSQVLQSAAPNLDQNAVRFLLDEQRELIRPFGERVSEFSLPRWTDTQKQLLQLQILKEPVDLSKAVTFEILKDVYRRRSMH